MKLKVCKRISVEKYCSEGENSNNVYDAVAMW